MQVGRGPWPSYPPEIQQNDSDSMCYSEEYVVRRGKLMNNVLMDFDQQFKLYVLVRIDVRWSALVGVEAGWLAPRSWRCVRSPILRQHR